jgi:glucosamine-6-phosphate deaminase
VDFMSTMKHSLLEGFYPKGWDMAKIDRCCSHPPEAIEERQPSWHAEFRPVGCEDVQELSVKMGHAIAQHIRRNQLAGRKVAFILPAGPMGMYRWAVYFLKAWAVDCSHVYGFNMDEWSNAEGNTLPSDNPGSFQYAMEHAFYNPLGELTVPAAQRHFATADVLPTYSEKIAALKEEGAQLITVFGIGRMMHIAFWEPQFGGEYDSDEQWRKETHRIGAKLHPLTIEQNAITSFKSRTTLVPCRANTIGPGLFLQSDHVIGGCDGALGRGMQWQGLSLWTTLRHEPNRWLPSTYMTTLPGELFYLRELAGPLGADIN